MGEKNFYFIMTTKRNRMEKIFLILLMGPLLASCTPLSRLTNLDNFSITLTPAVISSPSLIPTPVVLSTFSSENDVPALASAGETIATNSIHSISLGEESDIQITLDDRFLYFVGDVENWGLKRDSIYRIPLSGGTDSKPEKVAVTKYSGGRVNLFRPLVSGKWIIFADTPDSGDPATWMIRAKNLENSSERLVINVKDDKENLVGGFNFAAEGNILYWTMLVPQSDQQYEDTISMMDLDSGKTTILLNTKVDGTIWSLLGVSEGKIIVEQDQDENHGGSSSVFFFDPTSAQLQALPTGGASNMPLFSFPWVVLKAGPRYQWIKNLQVFNLQNFQAQFIILPGVDDSDPQIDGSRVYWSGVTDNASSIYAIYIFDLVNNTIYLYKASEQNILFPSIAIHDDTIAWLRQVNPLTEMPYAYLEWTTFK